MPLCYEIGVTRKFGVSGAPSVKVPEAPIASSLLVSYC